ncbi:MULTISPECIES: tail fiber domain-containing protein [Pseudomonas]|uniref:tail fiber domain-containing protein n=1 Tax=Pseudomonas TaxID=286 RepID=UPI002591B386|nr:MULTISPECIES: tail fiber domain-containing protein [Pseudomonas]
MAFNTRHPIGSTDPRDLYDNATNFDKLMNGPDPFYADRLGKQRHSWSGMEEDFNNAQEGRASQFNADQEERAARFDQFLQSSGFVVLGDYGPNIRIDEYNQLIVRDGYLYRLDYGVNRPYTTTGNWDLEKGNFVLQSQEDLLRQELAEPTGSSLVMDGDKTVADRLKGLPQTLASKGLTGTEDGYAVGYTGSGAAGVQGNGNKFNYYEYRITSDQISQVPGTNGASGPKVNGFHVSHNFGGPAAKGGRHAIEGNLLQGYGGAGATASDNPDRNYVGVQGQVLSDSGDGGTAASLKGAYFGISSYAGLLGGAKYAANLTSCEFNTYIAAGNNDRVSFHSGVQVASFIGERGYNVDAAIAISNLGGSTKGWKHGIYCHDANGKWPFDADSVFLKIQPAGTNTLDRLIDVRNVNFATSLISAQGVDIARTGMALTGPAATVILGDQATNSTISIQGRSGGQGAAYDSRILFLGGGTANLQGVVQVEGAQLVSPTVRPASDNVHSLGNASFRYSQLFASTGTINTSDEREKENIQDLPYGLDFIEALKAVSFTWKQGAAEVKRVITGYEEKEVPVTEEYEEEYADVEIRDGVAVQVIKTRTATRNVIDTLSVVDESGNPVMETKKEVYLEEVTDADGNTSSVPATREVEVQKTITVPRMQKIQEPVYGDETTFDSGKRTHFGMIAQQVKEAMATVGIDDFAGWTLADADNPDSRQGLRYEQFIPVLINAVKELSAQVKELQQRS